MKADKGKVFRELAIHARGKTPILDPLRQSNLGLVKEARKGIVICFLPSVANTQIID